MRASLLLAVILYAAAAGAAQVVVNGPPGTAAFGTTVTVLPNGNFVVTDQGFDAPGPIADVGAVFLYRPDGVLISTLRGSTANDQVGSGGVTVLSNGNYVVGSISWDNGAATDAGAATFGSGSTGISGVVSPSNSLVGSSANDRVSNFGITALSNGNYVVRSVNWDNGAATNAGAATFGSGTTGISGVVLPTNSLVGSTANDFVSANGISALSNGNYVVRSPEWNNGAATNAGAATFGLGTTGISGVVSPTNSLVGSSAIDLVSNAGITALSNGNYVVISVSWDNGATINAGAVSLGLGGGGVDGPLTTQHSVLGLVANSPLNFAYDPPRNQLVVGQQASNRVVLHRTGVATAISIVGDTPDPAAAGLPVTFTATVSASPAPGNGQVTFRASSGETCTDTTVTASSATTASFSCTITFTTAGVSTVIAEYTGSIIHAYSGSGAETHTTTPPDNVFANGFETP